MTIAQAATIRDGKRRAPTFNGPLIHGFTVGYQRDNSNGDDLI